MQCQLKTLVETVTWLKNRWQKKSYNIFKFHFRYVSFRRQIVWLNIKDMTYFSYQWIFNLLICRLEKMEWSFLYLCTMMKHNWREKKMKEEGAIWICIYIYNYVDEWILMASGAMSNNVIPIKLEHTILFVLKSTLSLGRRTTISLEVVPCKSATYSWPWVHDWKDAPILWSQLVVGFGPTTCS